MTLGQEFAAFAAMIADDEKRLRESAYLMCEINMGGTAIGTGINAPVGYVDVVTPKLAEISGVPVKAAANLIAATSDTGAFADISGVLKRIAVKLSKISNDLRLLLGPAGRRGRHQAAAAPGRLVHHAGQGEPGDPRGDEPGVLRGDWQRCRHHHGLRSRPAAAQRLRAADGLGPAQSLHHLASACQTLQVNCVEGIVANQNLLDERIAESVTLVTALNPLIGYEKAASHRQGRHRQRQADCRGGGRPGHHEPGRDAKAAGGRAADAGGRHHLRQVKLSKK
jgi:aspartate ammonia-lyase